MERGIREAEQGLRGAFAFGFAHPSEGTQLYGQLDMGSLRGGTNSGQSQSLEYFRARDAAIELANKYAPRIAKVAQDTVDQLFSQTSERMTARANSHIQALADKPNMGYVVSAKYGLLMGELRRVYLAARAAPRLSADGVVATLRRKPVVSTGMYANLEAMQNLHNFDEYQVVCAVCKQFADHAQSVSFEGLFGALAALATQQEQITIPFQDSAL